MACQSPTMLSRQVTVWYGEVSLEEVEDWVDGLQTARWLRLHSTQIVLPSGVSEASLKARTDKLKEVRDGGGEKIVNVQQWRTETGERYTWSDG